MNSFRMPFFVVVILLLVGVGQCYMATILAQTPEPTPPILMPASNEGLDAIQQFKYPKGLNCELFAAEPDVANIVAFHRDFSGRFFVCETFRQNANTGVEDNRKHPEWMDEELSAQSIQDRIDYIRKYIPNADQEYTANDDRIRLLVDSNNDGKSDRSTVFADHFNRLEMGTGAGVLSYRNNIYYTCIPDLFLLKDKNNDGVADERISLYTGFGVRFAFRGHDMHGLIVGPDGRLYFSIGDRGYDVNPKIHNVVSGAVFRCELDGSDLEVIATGLRNPQELAFDDYGNLFTGDNNSDSGDKARWVYIVPGSDSGWRMYYQYLADRGPFNREQIWHPFDNDTPAYIIPPVDNLGDGPSGLEYYPGTGFGDDFNGRFFLCDFRGGPVNSGIRSFRSEQVGAFWKITDSEQPVWGVLPTDLDFGSDGKLYMSDWVNGWVGENKGRIYALSDPTRIHSEIVHEVQSLLQTGFAEKSADELATLIGHADQRVRQESQFELVARNDLSTLKSVAAAGERLARVHAIWGIGQLVRAAGNTSKASTISPVTSRRQPGTDLASELPAIVTPLLHDKDFEIRVQAAQLAGDAMLPMSEKITTLLIDENLRVRFYAAMALAKIGNEQCVSPIATMLVENNDVDPMVRHGGIMALMHGLHTNSGADSIAAVAALAKHESPSVRRALVVAIRKAFSDPNSEEYNPDQLQSTVKALLSDSNRDVYLETVRSIYDLPITKRMSDLAAEAMNIQQRLDGSLHDDAILRRVINANLRIGAVDNAKALANLSINAAVSIERRTEAVQALTHWISPSNNDPVLNDWRPMDASQRKLADAQSVLVENFVKYITAPEPLSTAAIEAAGKLKLSSVGTKLEQVVVSESSSPLNRVSSLVSLEMLEYPELGKLLARLESGFDKLPTELAASVSELVSKTDAKRGFGLAKHVFDGAETPVSTKQKLIANMGKLSDADSAMWLADAIEQSKSGKFPAELRLDVSLAAATRTDANLSSLSKAYRDSMQSTENPSAVFADSLIGGNLDEGQKIFLEKASLSCVRCHRVDGTGGAVGPDLSGVAVKNDRTYLLDSIVQPNKVIAEGFAQIKVQTIDGLIHVGMLVSENEQEIQLMDADGKKISIAQDDVDGIKPGLSSMPDDLIKQITPLELRDLIEFLATRVTPAVTETGEEHK